MAVDVDLRGFSQFLQSHGIPHQISEESGNQVIWVGNELHAGFVNKNLANFDFELAAQQQSLRQSANNPAGVDAGRLAVSALTAFSRSPVTIALIVICLLVAAISGLGSFPSRMQWLFFPLVSAQGLDSMLLDLLTPVNALRSLTPMFLHFGELHLVFNMLWLWFFGRQLEPNHKFWHFVLIIVLTSFVSNASQYLYNGYNNFGGMSGVVYGLVGYAWIIHNFMPRSYLLLNNNMFFFFVVALVVMELIAGSVIASAAHLGGLLSGLLIGFGSVVYYRFILKQDSISR